MIRKRLKQLIFDWFFQFHNVYILHVRTEDKDRYISDRVETFTNWNAAYELMHEMITEKIFGGAGKITSTDNSKRHVRVKMDNGDVIHYDIIVKELHVYNSLS